MNSTEVAVLLGGLDEIVRAVGRIARSSERIATEYERQGKAQDEWQAKVDAANEPHWAEPCEHIWKELDDRLGAVQCDRCGQVVQVRPTRIECRFCIDGSCPVHGIHCDTVDRS